MQMVAAVLMLLAMLAPVTRSVSATSGSQRTSTEATVFTHLTAAATAATQKTDLVCLKERLRPPREGLSCPGDVGASGPDLTARLAVPPEALDLCAREPASTLSPQEWH